MVHAILDDPSKRDTRPHVLRCGECRSENVERRPNQEPGLVKYDCNDCGFDFSHKD